MLTHLFVGAECHHSRDCGILLSPLPRRLLHVLHIGRHPVSSISDPPLLSGVAWSTVSAGWPHHMHVVCLARYALALRRYALWLRGSLIAYLLCGYVHASASLPRPLTARHYIADLRLTASVLSRECALADSGAVVFGAHLFHFFVGELMHSVSLAVG